MQALIIALLAQVFLNGQSLPGAQVFIVTSPSATPTATATAAATPTATATPFIDPNALTVTPPPPSTLAVNAPVRLNWSVDANVAAVSVFDNGAMLPNQQGLAQPYTMVYRINGQRITPSFAGVAVWTPATSGPHQLDYLAYGDSGGQIDKVTLQVSVSP